MLCIRCGVSCTGTSGVSVEAGAAVAIPLVLDSGEGVLAVSCGADFPWVFAGFEPLHRNASPAPSKTFSVNVTANALR